MKQSKDRKYFRPERGFAYSLVAIAVVVLLAGAATTSVHAALVGLWRFEDSGDIGADSSDRANNLLPFGDAQFSSSSQVGNGALLLDGDGDFLTRATFPTDVPTGNSSYTIAAWINPSASGNLGIVGWGNYGLTNQSNGFRTNGASPNQLINYWWGNDLGGDTGTNLLTGDHPSGWHHVAAVFDSSNTTGTDHIIYVDGSPVVSRNSTNGINSEGSNFAVGRTAPAFNEFFAGLMDDVAIFDEALDAGQIATISTGDFSAFAVPEPGSLALIVMASLGFLRSRQRPRGQR